LLGLDEQKNFQVEERKNQQVYSINS
jgi:hypothetical protein